MIDRPFRGSEAVTRGRLTRGDLRSRRYQQVFRDVYVGARDEPLDLVTLSRAAFLLLGPHGALSGYSAAAMLQVDCAPRGVPAEIVAPGTGIRARPDLLVHRDALPASEVRTARGCRVTDPIRTADDLARRLDRTEAVVAVDALARRGRFDPAVLLARAARHPRRRGNGSLAGIVALADPRAESPMETRLRMLLHDHGLPAPAVQYELLDRQGYVVARFDLAYPAARLAIEYDGNAFHLHRRGEDNNRDIAAATLGWETMRFCADAVLDTPIRTAAAVAGMLAARTR